MEYAEQVHATSVSASHPFHLVAIGTQTSQVLLYECNSTGKSTYKKRNYVLEHKGMTKGMCYMVCLLYKNWVLCK